MYSEIKIQPYNHPKAAPVVGLRAWSPTCLVAAENLIALIKPVLRTEAEVEHVGSTAIPGCDGKGVLDLLVIVPKSGIQEACASLERLGFQRQSGGVIHSDERPMREGSIEFVGEIFRIHVHVVSKDSSLPQAFRTFRETLKARPDLVTEYIALKKTLIANGSIDRPAYTAEKSQFIQSLLSKI